MKNIAIIGSGPSSLFAAKTILENCNNINVSIYERGKAPQNRKCCSKTQQCKSCEYCEIINGGGGSGLFSDGKLVLDLTSGGNSVAINSLSLPEQKKLTSEILKTFMDLDGVSEFRDIPSITEQNKYIKLTKKNNLGIKFYPVMHMGTQNLTKITCNFIEFLKIKYGKRISFYFEENVVDILKNDDKFSIVTNYKEKIYDAVVAGVGKAGAYWLKNILKKFDCKFIPHHYFFGIRLETKTSNIENLLNLSYDPKIYRMLDDRKIKIHCVCQNGEILCYNYKGTMIVGGHSPYTKNNKEYKTTNTTNFNIMLSFDDEITPSSDFLNKFSTVDNKHICVQKLGDFRKNQNTVNWGELSPNCEKNVFKTNIRTIVDSVDSEFSKYLLEFIEAISNISNGIDDDSIIYAPAIEWDVETILVDKNLETTHKGLFAIGDGAGISQGIVYSAATGIIAAKEIVERYK